jgi:dipeptidyl aminopeptidase/acylaminoacyl peptidase
MFGDRSLTRFSRLFALAALASSFAASNADGQTQRTFTVDDALRVKSASVAAATDDARWLAITESTPRGRMGTDHFQFGDPTYVGPGSVDFLVMNAETGESQALFDEPVQVQGTSWSPDGDRLAFRRYENERVSLHIWNRASGNLQTVSSRPSRELAWGGPLTWAPDGESVLVGLRTSTWATEAKAAYEAMEYGPIVVQDSSEPFLSWDAVRNRGSLMELATINVESGAVTVLAEEGSYQDIRFAEDGSHVTYTKSTPLKTSYERGEGTEYAYFKQDLEAGAEAIEVMEKGDLFWKTPEADSAQNLTEEYRVPLSEADSTKRSFSLDQWHPDGDSMLVRAQDGYYLMEMGQEPEMVWAFPGENRKEWGEGPSLGITQWTEDGRYLFATKAAKDQWERGLVRYDLNRQQEEVLVLDSDMYRSWTVAEDGSRLVFRRSDGDRPDEIWTADGDFGNARKLTDVNPWLDDVVLSKSMLIKYYDVDGEELYGVLHLPANYEEGKEYPLVAEIYETFFNNGYSYSAQTLAAQGWMVLRPSVDLEMGFPGEAWMKGVTTAINSLMDKGMVDGRQLGIHGTSYGGYAASLIITQTDRFAAAINISGKVNMISFLGDSEKITTRNYSAAEEGQDRIGATLWEQPQKYWEHSAVMFADRVTTPHLLLTGHGDWNVPDTNTREMYYALRRLGKEVVWVNYMRAGHGAGRAGIEEDYRDHWRRIIEWYDTHFKKAVEEDEKGG